MSSFIFLLWIISSVIVVTRAVTDTDIKECGTDHFGQIKCNSVSTFYKECLVPGATSVEAIKLHEKISVAGCQFNSTFGIRSNVIWVTDGCSGDFLICYKGVPMPLTSSGAPPTTLTTTEAGSGDNGVILESNPQPETSNAGLYIGVILGVLALVAVGVLIGFMLLRRQTKEKTRRLIEARQRRLDVSHPNLSSIELPPNSTSSQHSISISSAKQQQRKVSNESLNEATRVHDSNNETSLRLLRSKPHTMSERGSSSLNGSIRSYSSARFATSGKSAGRFNRSQTSSNKRLSLAIDRRSYRTDGDSQRISRATSDPALFKSGSSYYSSQSSLGSITEENLVADLSTLPDATNNQTAMVKPLSSRSHFTTPIFKVDSGSGPNGNASRKHVEAAAQVHRAVRPSDSASTRSRSPSEVSVFSQMPTSSAPRRQHKQHKPHQPPPTMPPVARPSDNNANGEQHHYEDSRFATLSKRNKFEPSMYHSHHVDGGSNVSLSNKPPTHQSNDPPPLVFVVPETRLTKRLYETEYADPDELNGSYLNFGYYDDAVVTFDDDDDDDKIDERLSQTSPDYHRNFSAYEDMNKTSHDQDGQQKHTTERTPSDLFLPVPYSQNSVIYSQVSKPKPKVKPKVAPKRTKPKPASKPQKFEPTRPYFVQSCLKSDNKTDRPTSPLNVSFDGSVDKDSGYGSYDTGREKYGSIQTFKPQVPSYSDTIRQELLRENTRRIKLKETMGVSATEL